MKTRSKAKSYRIVRRINYRGTTIGPGEEIPSGMPQTQIRRMVEDGRIREIDPGTGLNIEPKSTTEIELGKDQIKSFFAKPSGHIAEHLRKTDFSVETLARMHTQAELMGAPQHVRQQIGEAIQRRMSARS